MGLVIGAVEVQHPADRRPVRPRRDRPLHELQGPVSYKGAHLVPHPRREALAGQRGVYAVRQVVQGVQNGAVHIEYRRREGHARRLPLPENHSSAIIARFLTFFLFNS